MLDLREATAVTVNVGQFVDKTDGVTPETAVSMTTTLKLSKSGGTFAARNSASAITHDTAGYYKVPLDATDTNTRGRLRLIVSDPATHLGVEEYFQVLASDVYDEKYGAQFLLQAATSTSATLDSGASAVNDFYTGALLVITVGTGAGQSRRITAYVGSTKIATIDTAWATTPTSSSNFRIIGASTVAMTAVERTAVAAAVLASATTTPIAADIKKINATTVNGNGLGTPWGP